MTITEKMAEFAFGLSLSDVPAHVERAVRRHLADTLACAVGAYEHPPVRALVGYARASAPRGGASLAAYGDRTSPAMASLVNGTMTRYLDANDISSFGGGHFSDGVPPLLAVAQNERLSADDLVLGAVALYEIQGALARSFDFMERGYHALTQIAWTTPIVAARMMGGDEDAAVHAAGLSGATGMALNTWLKPGDAIPSIKGVAVGLVGQRAVECAELAVRGVTASRDSLEFAAETLGAMGGAPPNFEAFDKLGSEWTTHRNIIKSYPSQIYTQAAVQAALALAAEVDGADEVEAMTLYGHRNVCGGVQGSRGAFRPQSRESADHSTPFAMAMALSNRRLTLREFEREQWSEPRTLEVMDRIRLVVDPRMDRAFVKDGVFGVRLEATLTDGSTRTVEVSQPKGHPDNPLSDEELIAKMSWLTDGVLPADALRRLFELCMGMSSTGDLAEMCELCVAETD